MFDSLRGTRGVNPMLDTLKSALGIGGEEATSIETEEDESPPETHPAVGEPTGEDPDGTVDVAGDGEETVPGPDATEALADRDLLDEDEEVDHELVDSEQMFSEDDDDEELEHKEALEERNLLDS